MLVSELHNVIAIARHNVIVITQHDMLEIAQRIERRCGNPE